MANEQQQTQPQVAIPLPKGKKNAVQIGCICMMLSVANVWTCICNTDISNSGEC